jgi:hypothetical protein
MNTSEPSKEKKTRETLTIRQSAREILNAPLELRREILIRSLKKTGSKSTDEKTGK